MKRPRIEEGVRKFNTFINYKSFKPYLDPNLLHHLIIPSFFSSILLLPHNLFRQSFLWHFFCCICFRYLLSFPIQIVQETNKKKKKNLSNFSHICATNAFFFSANKIVINRFRYRKKKIHAQMTNHYTCFFCLFFEVYRKNTLYECTVVYLLYQKFIN